MNKRNIFRFLSVYGYTAAQRKHSEFPKRIVLEHLNSSNRNRRFKRHYREFINLHFQ